MKDIFDSWITKTPIAHRGLHNKDIPENSLSAFKNAIEHGYAIEIDLQITKDNKIIVFHILFHIVCGRTAKKNFSTHILFCQIKYIILKNLVKVHQRAL